MGLDTSHDCWHGAYSAFMRWRIEIAKHVGIELQEMEGYISNGKSWDFFKKDPLYVLLTHSDCDGEIKWQDCGPLADRLEELLPKLDGDGGHIGNHKEKTKTFILGLRDAFEAKENVEFH